VFFSGAVNTGHTAQVTLYCPNKNVFSDRSPKLSVDSPGCRKSIIFRACIVKLCSLLSGQRNSGASMVCPRGVRRPLNDMRIPAKYRRRRRCAYSSVCLILTLLVMCYCVLF